jgi:hypothetical protein
MLIFLFSSISVYGKAYLDYGSMIYWPWNTDYSENPDSSTNLNLLQLWSQKWFFSKTLVNTKLVDNFLIKLSIKYKNKRIWVRMREIWSKYRTGQRQFWTSRDDVMQKDLTSRCNTQTKLRTRPDPVIWLWLRHELNKTNLKIKFAKAQKVIEQRKL